MPANEAEAIYLRERERRHLQALVRQQTCPQRLALSYPLICVGWLGFVAGTVVSQSHCCRAEF
jgi:hypothetical protein